MLDTNVLIDFLFVERKEEKGQSIPKRLEKVQRLHQALVEGRFQLCASEWGVLELRDQVEQLNLEQKMLENGFHPREFGQARRDFTSTPDDLALTRRIVEELFQTAKTHPARLEDGELLALGHQGVSTLDAALVLSADRHPDCTYFVTRDGELRDSITRGLTPALARVKIVDPEHALHALETN